MNPFKTMFSAMALIYLIIFVWSVIMHFTGSISISAVGLVLCVSGWFMSDRYLS